MEGLLSVSVGTIFWASVAFLVVLFILKKYAWGPILKSLDERSEGIERALNEADKARQEISQMKAGNEQLLRDARNERDAMFRDAKIVKDNIINEAREKAQSEAERIMGAARDEIENQKKRAITELKNQVAVLSIEIAEKLVKEKLSDPEKQKALNQALAAEIKAN